MNTCEEHEDAVVVYKGRMCPLCDKIVAYQEAILQLTTERAGLQKELDDADAIIGHFESVYADYPEMEAVVRLRE